MINNNNQQNMIYNNNQQNMTCDHNQHEISIFAPAHDAASGVTDTRPLIQSADIVQAQFDYKVNDRSLFAVKFVPNDDFSPPPTDFGPDFNGLVVEIWGKHGRNTPEWIRHISGISRFIIDEYIAVGDDECLTSNPCYPNTIRQLAVKGLCPNDIFSSAHIMYPPNTPYADKSGNDLAQIMYDYINENLGTVANISPPRYIPNAYPNISIPQPDPILAPEPYEGVNSEKNLLTVLQEIAAYSMNEHKTPIVFRAWHPEGSSVPVITITEPVYDKNIVLSFRLGTITKLVKNINKATAKNAIVASAADGSRIQYAGISQRDQLMVPSRVRETVISADDDMTDEQMLTAAQSQFAKLVNLPQYTVTISESLYWMINYGKTAEQNPFPIVRLKDCGEDVYCWVTGYNGTISAQGEEHNITIIPMPWYSPD